MFIVSITWGAATTAGIALATDKIIIGKHQTFNNYFMHGVASFLVSVRHHYSGKQVEYYKWFLNCTMTACVMFFNFYLYMLSWYYYFDSKKPRHIMRFCRHHKHTHTYIYIYRYISIIFNLQTNLETFYLFYSFQLTCLFRRALSCSNDMHKIVIIYLN